MVAKGISGEFILAGALAELYGGGELFYLYAIVERKVNVNDHLSILHLLVLKKSLSEVENWLNAGVIVREYLYPFVSRLCLEYSSYLGLYLGDVLGPYRALYKILAADSHAEVLPELRLEGAYAHILAVLCLVIVIHASAVKPFALTLRLLARHKESGSVKAVEWNASVHHSDVDELSLARVSPVIYSGKYADNRVKGTYCYICYLEVHKGRASFLSSGMGDDSAS